MIFYCREMSEIVSNYGWGIIVERMKIKIYRRYWI